MPDAVRHVGIYPGTFDPIHNGHVDIIGRAARVLHKLVVGVAENAGKGPLFPLGERVELVRGQFKRDDVTTIGRAVVNIRGDLSFVLDDVLGHIPQGGTPHLTYIMWFRAGCHIGVGQ
jgi:cytidyltransferase-like protein